MKQTRSRCCSRSGVSGLATARYAARKRAKSPFPAGGCYGEAAIYQRRPAVAISQQGLEAALDQPLTRILEQVQLALDSAQEKPDVIYLTGGSARSPLIKKRFPNSYRAYPSLAAMISAPSPQDWRAGRRSFSAKRLASPALMD